jgi:hypothetical protein
MLGDNSITKAFGECVYVIGDVCDWLKGVRYQKWCCLLVGVYIRVKIKTQHFQIKVKKCGTFLST